MDVVHVKGNRPILSSRACNSSDHAGKLSLAIMLLKATCRWTTLLFVSNVSLSVTRRYARSNNIAVGHSNLLLDNKIAAT